MPKLIAMLAAFGGITIWRRKKVRSDVEAIGAAARDSVHGLRTGRKALLTELGERAYARSTGDDDPDNEGEISRIVGELVQIDATTKVNAETRGEALSSNDVEGLEGADATA